MQSDMTVKSICEYVEKVTTVSAEWRNDKSFIAPWFRGIGDSEFKLVPRLYREHDINHLEEEGKIRRAFSDRAMLYAMSTRKREPWDWYFLMQHYGVPTRLLDWTESALVALYFALYTRDTNRPSVPAVWILDPIALNLVTVGVGRIVVPGEGGLDKHLPQSGSAVDSPYPVAVGPEYADPRMTAQQSKFTMHGHLVTALDEIEQLQVLRKKGQLVRILIAGKDEEAFEDLKQSLTLLGMRNSTVFPDLTGLAMDIRQDYTLEQ